MMERTHDIAKKKRHTTRHHRETARAAAGIAATGTAAAAAKGGGNSQSSCSLKSPPSVSRLGSRGSQRRPDAAVDTAAAAAPAAVAATKAMVKLSTEGPSEAEAKSGLTGDPHVLPTSRVGLGLCARQFLCGVELDADVLSLSEISVGGGGSCGPLGRVKDFICSRAFPTSASRADIAAILAPSAANASAASMLRSCLTERLQRPHVPRTLSSQPDAGEGRRGRDSVYVRRADGWKNGERPVRPGHVAGVVAFEGSDSSCIGHCGPQGQGERGREVQSESTANADTGLESFLDKVLGPATSPCSLRLSPCLWPLAIQKSDGSDAADDGKEEVEEEKEKGKEEEEQDFEKVTNSVVCRAPAAVGIPSSSTARAGAAPDLGMAQGKETSGPGEKYMPAILRWEKTQDLEIDSAQQQHVVPKKVEQQQQQQENNDHHQAQHQRQQKHQQNQQHQQPRQQKRHAQKLQHQQQQQQHHRHHEDQQQQQQHQHHFKQQQQDQWQHMHQNQKQQDQQQKQQHQQHQPHQQEWQQRNWENKVQVRGQVQECDPPRSSMAAARGKLRSRKLRRTRSLNEVLNRSVPATRNTSSGSSASCSRSHLRVQNGSTQTCYTAPKQMRRVTSLPQKRWNDCGRKLNSVLETAGTSLPNSYHTRAAVSEKQKAGSLYRTSTASIALDTLSIASSISYSDLFDELRERKQRANKEGLEMLRQQIHQKLQQQHQHDGVAAHHHHHYHHRLRQQLNHQHQLRRDLSRPSPPVQADAPKYKCAVSSLDAARQGRKRQDCTEAVAWTDEEESGQLSGSDGTVVATSGSGGSGCTPPPRTGRPIRKVTFALDEVVIGSGKAATEEESNEEHSASNAEQEVCSVQAEVERARYNNIQRYPTVQLEFGAVTRNRFRPHGDVGLCNGHKVNQNKEALPCSPRVKSQAQESKAQCMELPKKSMTCVSSTRSLGRTYSPGQLMARSNTAVESTAGTAKGRIGVAHPTLPTKGHALNDVAQLNAVGNKIMLTRRSKGAPGQKF